MDIYIQDWRSLNSLEFNCVIVFTKSVACSVSIRILETEETTQHTPRAPSYTSTKGKLNQEFHSQLQSHLFSFYTQRAQRQFNEVSLNDCKCWFIISAHVLTCSAVFRSWQACSTLLFQHFWQVLSVLCILPFYLQWLKTWTMLCKQNLLYYTVHWYL